MFFVVQIQTQFTHTNLFEYPISSQCAPAHTGKVHASEKKGVKKTFLNDVIPVALLLSSGDN